MGPIESAIRSSVRSGDELHTPARGRPFIVGRIDSDGLVLLLGKGRWATPLSWRCLEGVPDFLAARGWVAIGSKYDVASDRGTLDAYLKRCVNRATAGWVAAVLERAGVVEIDRRPPARVRLLG